MIQSGKFDSPNMNIKKIANSLLIFITNKIIEIMGILVSIFGILLLIALLSYSPSDPNFIFSDNTEIKNFLGFQGSYISDFFFQAFGIISFLIPLTYFLSGIKVVKEKKIFFLIENTFLYYYLLNFRCFILHLFLQRCFLPIHKWKWRFCRVLFKSNIY